MERESNLAKNTLIISFGTILPQLATIITLPILTGCLTKEEMGIYDLVTVLVTLILPAATLQIQTAAFRFLIDLRESPVETATIITNIIAFTIPISLIVLIALFFFLPSEQVSVRLWICLFFFMDLLSNTCRQICRGIGNNAAFSVSSIIVSLSKMFSLVILVYILRWGLIGTLISLFVSSFISLCFLVFKTKIYKYIVINSISGKVLKELLCYTWPMVPNGMSAWIMRLSDRLVVAACMGITANAVYSVANKIPNILQVIQHTFTLAWQENASVVSKDYDASQYYSKMFRSIYDLTAGIVGLLIAATPLLFRLLIRGDYTEAYYQMPILFIGVFFLSMSTFLGGIYVAYKKSKSVGITTTIAAAINLITDIAMINKIGLYAASGSTLVAYSVLFGYRIIDIQKIIKVKVSWRHSIAVFIVLAVESFLCYLHRPMFNYINLVTGILVFFFLNKEFVRNSQKIANRMIEKKLLHK